MELHPGTLKDHRVTLRFDVQHLKAGDTLAIQLRLG